LRFLGYAAGEYIGAEETEVAHAGLGASVYCHATSPLRRYADLVNQRVLKALTNATDTNASALAKWLNERAKEARAYERESWCLAHLSATELRSATGWIVKASETGYRIYVPAWRRMVKVRTDYVGNMGDAVEVTAFWDTRGTPEHRFVFRIKQIETEVPRQHCDA
jgi:exoribonuclease R